MKILYGACAFNAGSLRLQRHALRLCNTCCFPTTTMINQTRLHVTFIGTLPILFQIVCALMNESSVETDNYWSRVSI